MYAIIRTGGHQYRAREGETLEIETVAGFVGDEVIFEEVLLLDNFGDVTVGAPTVPGASVTGAIVAQTRGPKLLAMKYKNKTRSRTVRGHRQHLTKVKITLISAG
ncbi:MAG: 50S ribosomal protein L21 [Dehalococcoidia bacterium]|nr:50S ribosomal protein L21 [Dehalococcoidia bacterium]